VVSEERGTISFCFSGNIVQNLDAESLRNALLGLFGRATRKPKAPPKPSKIDSLVSVVTPRSAPPTSKPSIPPAEPKPEGRTLPPKLVTGTIRAPEPRGPDSRAPEPRVTDSDRPPSLVPAERPKLDSVPPPATTTPLPVSEGVALRSESRLMPPARTTFVPSAGAEVDESPTGDEP
jgi:diadenylate cyclase